MHSQPVSLSGVDGVGKSQQIRLLNWGGVGFYPTKPLIQYNDRWPKTTGPDSSRWWFEVVPIRELAAIMIEALNRRNRDCGDGIPLHDRGWRMFQAVVVATWITREELEMEEVVAEVGRWFKQGLDHDPQEREVLLLPDAEYFASVKRYKRFFAQENRLYSASMNARYARYQENLRRVIEYCFQQNPDVRRLPVSMSIIDVQNELRNFLGHAYGFQLPPLARNVSRVIGFGGLSECGKSTFAGHLRERGFYRLKLRYFIEALQRQRREATPEKVAEELLFFMESHYYVIGYTLESLHDPYIPAYLKLFFGHRMRIVYLEVDEETRVRRSATELAVSEAVARERVREKDRIKIDRGAREVREIADLVFDNSSSSTSENLIRFVEMLG